MLRLHDEHSGYELHGNAERNGAALLTIKGPRGAALGGVNLTADQVMQLREWLGDMEPAEEAERLMIATKRAVHHMNAARAGQLGELLERPETPAHLRPSMESELRLLRQWRALAPPAGEEGQT